MKWLCWKIIKMIKWLWNKRQLEPRTHEIGTITICGPEKYRFTYYTCGSISAPIISPQSSYPSFHYNYYTNTNHPHKYRLRRRLSHTGYWIKYLYGAGAQSHYTLLYYTIQFIDKDCKKRSQAPAKLQSVSVVASIPPPPPPLLHTTTTTITTYHHLNVS